MSDAPPSARFDPWEALRVVRNAGPALATQAGFYGELVMVEWSEERRRLQRLFLATTLSLVFLICTLLGGGGLLLAATWQTAWRWPTALAVLAVYAFGLGWAWRRMLIEDARSSESFRATREELAADLAMLRSRA